MTRLAAAESRAARAGLRRQLPRAAGGARRGARPRRHRRAARRRASAASAARPPTRRSTRGRPDPLLARLAAVADGTGAVVAGIGRQRHDYGQVARGREALAARRTPASPTSASRRTGPFALLPEGDHYGLVWTVTPAGRRELLALDDAAFLARARAPFRRARPAASFAWPIGASFPLVARVRARTGRQPLRRPRQRGADAAPGRRAGLQRRPARCLRAGPTSCSTRRARASATREMLERYVAPAPQRPLAPASRSRTAS